MQSGYALAANTLDGAAVGLIPKTLGMLTGRDLKRVSMQALISDGNLQVGRDPVPRIDGDMIASITQFKFKAGNMWAEDEHLRDAMPDVSNWYTNEFLLRKQ